LLLAPAIRNRFKNGEDINPNNLHDYFQVLHYKFNKEIPLFNSYIYDAQQYVNTIEPTTAVDIIHGNQDDVVPISESQNYAAQYPDKVHLIEVVSGHRLEDQIDLIWEQILKFV
jgi:pimeloyl-ACP methyl ester carboxylesterase